MRTLYLILYISISNVCLGLLHFRVSAAHSSKASMSILTSIEGRTWVGGYVF